MLLYVLSVDDRTHSMYRCYQRTILTEAFGLLYGGHLRIDALRTLTLSYILDATSTATLESELEARAHGDLLRVPDAQTCLGKVISALRHLRDSPVRYDAMLFSDDDAFIHPHRLVLDLAEFGWARYLVFGTLSWGAAWDEKKEVHLGYGNTAIEVAGFLVDRWRQSRTEQGPYPFPNGFVMGLSNGTVAAINDALDAQPRLRALHAHLRRKAPTRKCSPEPDAGLGYLIARLPAELPLTFADLTSSQRVHFWRTRTTEDQLSRSIAILHGAKDWAQHFEFAARVVSLVPHGQHELSRPHRCSAGHAELRRLCAAAALPSVGRGRPAQPPRCPAQYGRYLTPNLTWCSIDERAPPRVRPAAANVSRALFAPSREAPRCPYIVAGRDKPTKPAEVR